MSPPNASPPPLQLISMLIHFGSSKPQVCDSKQSRLVTFLSNLKHRFLFASHEHMWAFLPDDYKPRVELAFCLMEEWYDATTFWGHSIDTWNLSCNQILCTAVKTFRARMWKSGQKKYGRSFSKSLMTYKLHLPPSTWGDSIKESSERESPEDTILRFWEPKRNVIIGFISI